jgi:RNA polymerase sigma-70 factor (ECF subfamily)
MPPRDPVSAALESLIARCASLVRAIGMKHGLGQADVDELFQDVRIRLWRARPDGEQIVRLPASYVYQTAVSAVLDRMRRRRARREEDIDEKTVDERYVAAPRGPEDDLRASELGRQVADAVDRIPASRRLAVRMHLQGYHRDEIAAMLGWTPAKARNLIYRGLDDLRAELSREGIGPEARV